MDTYTHQSLFHLTIVNSVQQLKMFVNGVRIATGMLGNSLFQQFSD